MPSPAPVPSPCLLTRRGLLAGAAGALVVTTGCTADGSSTAAGVRRPGSGEPDPDIAIAAEALADRRTALEEIAATTDRHPRLADLLAATVLVLEDHAGLLADAAPGPSGDPSAGASSSSGPSPSPTAGPSGRAGTARRVRVPGDRDRALAALAAAQRDLATATKRHAFAAESGAFARLLGSMAAAATQQALRIEESVPGRKDGRG